MSLQQKTVSNWIAVAAVLPITLCMVGHVHGQGTGSEAMFQGRPAMAGAQGGTGAMAGPPQGGVAPQSVDQPGGGVQLRKPSGLDQPKGGEQSVPRDPGVGTPDNPGSGLTPKRDRDSGEVVKKDRDATGDANSTTKKAKRGLKRSYERARRGVSGIDS
ncbi:hypothetical protein ACPWT1_04305 [Ramlibacter sp. MMS24-I3-19]|uniref:hypothetical protein n=1 Tax=Ramlibacter sp. MMS24-I3-19 TaxID=3416606 RepID=UPI003D00AB42